MVLTAGLEKLSKTVGGILKARRNNELQILQNLPVPFSHVHSCLYFF
jgi:hypothetical protein